MMFARSLVAVCCLLSLHGHSQQEAPLFRHELSFTTENDAYLFRKHDAYYTNGFFLRFTAAAGSDNRKLVRSYELGQMIYTPLIRKTQTTADIDRPYCGFLYGKYSNTAFTAGEGVLQYSTTLGVVGAASWGEGLQESYHSLFGYGQFTGWKYQVQNAVGIDLGLLYAKTVWQDSSWAKLVPVVQASVGSNYTFARAGAYLCFGALEKNRNSALWNARVQQRETSLYRRSEFFAFWYPEVEWQGYNATVQGGLFTKGTGAVLANPERLMLQHTIGICYAGAKCSAKLGVVFQDREATSQKTPQQYASLQFSCRMR